MAIAKADSVTVSIAAEAIGTLMVIFLVNFVCILTSLGSTWEKAGTKRTSSYVSPSPKILFSCAIMLQLRYNCVQIYDLYWL